MSSMVKWYQVDIPYACGGIAVDEQERVCTAAPIFKWMVMRTLSEVRAWVKSKKGNLIEVEGGKP